MKPAFRLFGAVTLLGSVAAGAYYFLFMRDRRPQVELYFDDGSMVSMPGDAEEAAPFVTAATEILAEHPVAS